ncbi:MAG: molecular chaperone HtpG [Lentisphaerae bacterium]|nr:molecular chaperone HtpG [Lentisphaerota bacterium]
MAETMQFKAEVKQLLDLVIHSLYSNPDIFLRELIANAADAVDKARFAALTDDKLAQEWKIELAIDKEKRLLSITDNGIGMTADEVKENIGTIAKSGTRAFLENLKNAQTAGAPELIGQFGVGFYSAFMVADEVVIESRRAGSDAPAVRWSSNGTGEYTIEETVRENTGTTITLHIKGDKDIYLENWKISEIVRKYSDFIEYPITLPFTKTNEDKTTTVEVRTLNSQKAIWLRNASEVTAEEHEAFFSHLAHGGKPLTTININAEGTNEFKALIYIPEEMPFNLFMPDLQKKGLQLYVKRVFITDNCEALVPDYLRFLRGVVDSSDLPLNVSREILQENPLLAQIKRSITGKVLGELKKMLERDPDKYKKFFKEFGKILKEGIHLDMTNQEKLKDLVMFESMNGQPGELITLKEYINAMPSEQEHIYYIIAESRQLAMSSPALEIFRSKGYDVLLMTDPVDEFIMQNMMQYDKKYLKSANKGELEIEKDPDAEEKALEAATKQHQKLLDYIFEKLQDKLSAVRLTRRLTDSVCCLVGESNSISPQLERLLKAMNQPAPESKRVLELNPGHPVVGVMQKLIEEDPSSEKLAQYTELLYGEALLTEGSPLPDPLAFVKNVSALMK